MNSFALLQEYLEKIKCTFCGGLGEINDADLGDISYRRWQCNDCRGTGLKPDALHPIVWIGEHDWSGIFSEKVLKVTKQSNAEHGFVIPLFKIPFLPEIPMADAPSKTNSSSDVVPKDISVELWREYDIPGRAEPYRIENPQRLYTRTGGTTHRIADQNGVVHCVPAPGFNGCVLRWKQRQGEVTF